MDFILSHAQCVKISQSNEYEKPVFMLFTKISSLDNYCLYIVLLFVDFMFLSCLCITCVHKASRHSTSVV